MLTSFRERLFGGREEPESEPKEESKETTPTKENYKSSPKEVILESRDFEREGRLLGGAVGDARFVKIMDDGGGVFKPHTGHDQKAQREYISRERAAYLISRFLGFDFVPPTVIKIVNGVEGSLQEFIEDAKTRAEVDYFEIDPSEKVKLAIFDILIANNDRNSGNYLIKDGKIIAIDHGFSLFPDDFKNGIWDKINVIPADIAEKLRRFIEAEEQVCILRDLLAELLGEQIAEMFIKRLRAFVGAINDDLSFNEKKFSKSEGIIYY